MVVAMLEASATVEVDEALPDEVGKLKQLVLELRGALAYEKEKYKALLNMHFGSSRSVASLSRRRRSRVATDSPTR